MFFSSLIFSNSNNVPVRAGLLGKANTLENVVWNLSIWSQLRETSFHLTKPLGPTSMQCCGFPILQEKASFHVCLFGAVLSDVKKWEWVHLFLPWPPRKPFFDGKGRNYFMGCIVEFSTNSSLSPILGKENDWVFLNWPLAIPFTPVLHLNCSPSATDCSTPFLSGKVVNVLSVMVANWY